MSDKADRNTKKKKEKLFSEFGTYFKRHMAFRKPDESLFCSDKT
jgi:hypothetical protein